MIAWRPSNLAATLMSYFVLGWTTAGGGTRLKADGSGNLAVRNQGDSADGALTTSNVNISGNSLTLNSAAGETGANWKLILARPTTGQTADQTITLPAGNGTSGQAVTIDGAGNWGYTSIATSSSIATETTTVAFNSSSPITQFTLPATAVVWEMNVIVDTPFTGGTGSTLTVGVSGTTAKYLGATDSDLSTAGTYGGPPGLTADGSTEALIITYAQNSATAGSARVVVKYSIPVH